MSHDDDDWKVERMQEKTLQDAVADKLAQAGPEVRTRVINARAESEIQRRANLISEGMAALDKLQVQLNKSKPDQKSLRDDGTVISESWSPKALEERNKLIKRIEGFTGAINTALERNDFAPLEKALKSQSQPQAEKPPSTDEQA